jgi:Rhs element Vgr protein
MSSKPNIKGGSVATFVVKVDGSAVADVIDFFSIEVDKRINRVSRALLVIKDGEASTAKFNISSSSTFVPGAEISIEAGYDSQNEVIFQGIVTGQSIKINDDVGSSLEVECRDKAIKMTVGRKSKTYSKQKDSDILNSIISAAGGLTSNVTSTDTTWEEQVQYYATDWDYILTRAEANGLIVTTDSAKVSVVKPDANTSSVITTEFGDNILEFDCELSAVEQMAKVQATSWDYKTQKMINGEASNNVSGAGNLTSKKLSSVIDLPEFDLQTSANLPEGDLVTWSKAELVKSEYSKIQGDIKILGSSLINPANYITLAGVGDRFNGDALASGVRHSISDGIWETEITVGLSSTWFSEDPDVMSPPAAGLLPGARGLFNATVKKMYEDPENQYRILIDIPLFDKNGEGLWARLSNFYSTSGAGVFFLPEVGDEVVIGFLNEDPRFPIILGSLYSSSNIKPFEGLSPADKNPKKAIVSKSGMYVEFDDENVVLTATTPGKNKAVFSDKDKTITIQDQNNNSIVMSASGIEMKSDKSITIQAAQNLILKGDMGISIESSAGDIEEKGLNIKESAEMQYSAKGSVSAQVQGGAELTLKGAMVMIN